MSLAPKFTFIIPTLGRDTLMRSVQCLFNQTLQNWNAIIIFDGIQPNISIDDERITIIQIEKSGLGTNQSADVRNKGIYQVQTEWVSFLDDDDTISSNYLELLMQEINNNNPDVVIFRMKYSAGIIYPQLDTDNFYDGAVGISFSVKKSIFDSGFKFYPSTTEDFNFLDTIRSHNFKMIISPYVTYFIRIEPFDAATGNRVFINY